MKRLLSTILPSMIAGGLLFGSAFGHAASGDPSFGFWPAASDATAPTRQPPTSPAPPAPTAKPTPPVPPAPPAGGPRPPKPAKPPAVGSIGGFSIDGIKDMVVGQIDTVRSSLKNNPNIPKDVRDKVTARLDKVRATLDKRLSNLDLSDLDKLGDEMEKMGEELEQAMEGLDDEMGKLGDKLGKDIAKQVTKDLGKNLGKLHLDFDFDADDDDDDDNIPMTPDVDADDDDMRDAINDLKDLSLKPAQRAQITKLRTDSDKAVATAKTQLDDLSTKLRAALGNPATSDADITRLVDQISAQEAVIRKARILAWAQARRVLDDGQRKKIEDASKKKTK